MMFGKKVMAASSTDDMNDSEDGIQGAVQRLAAASADAFETVKAHGQSGDLAVTMREIEALLFAAAGPMSAADLTQRLKDGSDVGGALMALKRLYEGRGVNLVEVAGKWRFLTASDLGYVFGEVKEEPRKLSKAALETLAVVAYHQPVTRAEIEQVRGVAVSKGTLDALIEVGWVRPRGRRRAPGKPLTYGTTEDFLLHFGLSSVDDLPGKADLVAQGLLDSRVIDIIDIPAPGSGNDDEEPLDAAQAEALFHTDFMDAPGEEGDVEKPAEDDAGPEA
jgi:segregation and condensation protein B